MKCNYVDTNHYIIYYYHLRQNNGISFSQAQIVIHRVCKLHYVYLSIND